MEKISKSRNSDVVDKDERKERSAVALFLVSMKHDILDSETSIALEKMVQADCDKYAAIQARKKQPQHSVSAPAHVALHKRHLSVQPMIGDGIDGSVLPQLPPIPSLISVIERCSLPFQKQLTDSDLQNNQCRLILYCRDFKSAIIPLLNESENVKKGIPVTTYDSEGKAYDMELKNWGSKVHVLKGIGWKRFFQEHGLEDLIDWVTVWAFRHNRTGGLCFAITCRRSQTDGAIPSKNKAAKQKESRKKPAQQKESGKKARKN